MSIVAARIRSEIVRERLVHREAGERRLREVDAAAADIVDLPRSRAVFLGAFGVGRRRH